MRGVNFISDCISCTLYSTKAQMSEPGLNLASASHGKKVAFFSLALMPQVHLSAEKKVAPYTAPHDASRRFLAYDKSDRNRNSGVSYFCPLKDFLALAMSWFRKAKRRRLYQRPLYVNIEVVGSISFFSQFNSTRWTVKQSSNIKGTLEREVFLSGEEGAFCSLFSFIFISCSHPAKGLKGRMEELGSKGTPHSKKKCIRYS